MDLPRAICQPVVIGLNQKDLIAKEQREEWITSCMVEHSSKKGILIDIEGSMLNEIGSGARLRLQIQKLIDGPVYLGLLVKMVPHCRQKPGRLEKLGCRGESFIQRP